MKRPSRRADDQHGVAGHAGRGAETHGRVRRGQGWTLFPRGSGENRQGPDRGQPADHAGVQSDEENCQRLQRGQAGPPRAQTQHQDRRRGLSSVCRRALQRHLCDQRARQGKSRRGASRPPRRGRRWDARRPRLQERQTRGDRQEPDRTRAELPHPRSLLGPAPVVYCDESGRRDPVRQRPRIQTRAGRVRALRKHRRPQHHARQIHP